jgi:F0F1-type ATP synthase assembly protein I
MDPVSAIAGAVGSIFGFFSDLAKTDAIKLQAKEQGRAIRVSSANDARKEYYDAMQVPVYFIGGMLIVLVVGIIWVAIRSNKTN